MRGALRSRRGIVEKKMFGGYCWMLNGNMLCGVEVGRYMFRVGKDLEAEALSLPGARPMDITGRPMRGYSSGSTPRRPMAQTSSAGSRWPGSTLERWRRSSAVLPRGGCRLASSVLPIDAGMQ